MKVIHAAKFYPPYVGGMETFLQYLCDGTAGEWDVRVHYFPLTFYLGLAASLVTIALLVAIAVRRRGSVLGMDFGERRA